MEVAMSEARVPIHSPEPAPDGRIVCTLHPNEYARRLEDFRQGVFTHLRGMERPEPTRPWTAWPVARSWPHPRRRDERCLPMSDQGLRTGELAQRAEANVQTLRYYERRGLLALRPTTVQPTGRADPERDDCQVQAQRARGPGDLQLRRHPNLPGGNRPFLWDGHRLLHTSVVAILRQHRPVEGASASGQR